MANTFAPNGFSHYQGSGSTSSYENISAAINPLNTQPIFFGDPVTQATNATGGGTGYITQGYGPVTLTVAAAGIVISATGVMTVTFTAAVAASGNLPTAVNTWAPPVGSTLIIQGASIGNGAYTVTSASANTAVVSNSGQAAGTSSASGTVTVIVPITGVFVGCKFLSVSGKVPVSRPFWQGSDANGDVQAFIISDENANFSVCTGNSAGAATPVQFANVEQNISFGWNNFSTVNTNGNLFTGISTMFADRASLISSALTGPALNSYLPFRIIALQNYVPGQTSPLVSINGNDPTTEYNRVIVGFNNSMRRNLAGI